MLLSTGRTVLLPLYLHGLRPPLSLPLDFYIIHFANSSHGQNLILSFSVFSLSSKKKYLGSKKMMKNSSESLNSYSGFQNI